MRVFDCKNLLNLLELETQLESYFRKDDIVCFWKMINECCGVRISCVSFFQNVDNRVQGGGRRASVPDERVLSSHHAYDKFQCILPRGISLPKPRTLLAKNPFVFKKNPSKIRINPFVLTKSRTPFPRSQVPLAFCIHMVLGFLQLDVFSVLESFSILFDLTNSF